MAKDRKEKPPSSSTSLHHSASGIAMISIGSLLSLLGGTCMLFFYPSECVLTDPNITCETTDVLFLGGTVAFLVSGGSMMLCGLAFLCCLAEDKDFKVKNPESGNIKKSLKHTQTTTISATYIIKDEKTKGCDFATFATTPITALDINRPSNGSLRSHEAPTNSNRPHTVGIHRPSDASLHSPLRPSSGRTTDVVYYPPPSYYNQNLVYGCHNSGMTGQMESSA